MQEYAQTGGQLCTLLQEQHRHWIRRHGVVTVRVQMGTKDY